MCRPCRESPLGIIAVRSRPPLKGAWRAARSSSDLDLVRDLQGVIDLDAQVPHCRLELGVAQQEPTGPEVRRAFVCISMSPSCVASSACRRRTDRGRRPRPNVRRSSRTAEWRDAGRHLAGSERGSLQTSGRPSRSRPPRPYASARSVRTAQAAASCAARPSRVRPRGFRASRRAPAG